MGLNSNKVKKLQMYPKHTSRLWMFDSSGRIPFWTQTTTQWSEWYDLSSDDKCQPKPTETHCTQGLDMLPKFAECCDGQRDRNGRGNVQVHTIYVCTASPVFAYQL